MISAQQRQQRQQRPQQPVHRSHVDLLVRVHPFRIASSRALGSMISVSVFCVYVRVSALLCRRDHARAHDRDHDRRLPARQQQQHTRACGSSDRFDLLECDRPAALFSPQQRRSAPNVVHFIE